MLGRKNYTAEEIDQGRAAIAQQLAAYKRLCKALGAEHKAARTAFEANFFNNMVLVLDRYFVHRLSGPDFEGKDGNPLNEVRIISDSLMNHGGIMRSDKQIKLQPEKSVVPLNVGDRINLTQVEFEALSAAFFDELEKRFR